MGLRGSSVGLPDETLGLPGTLVICPECARIMNCLEFPENSLNVCNIPSFNVQLISNEHPAKSQPTSSEDPSNQQKIIKKNNSIQFYFRNCFGFKFLTVCTFFNQ